MVVNTILPEEKIQPFTEQAKNEGRQSVLLMMELERVISDLEAAGCQPVVLKGAALAAEIYPQPEHRFMVDLDILVPRDQVNNAWEVLKKLGYGFVETGRDLSFYTDYHFHWILMDQRGFVVEIHWALTLPASIHSFDLEGLRNRSRIIALNSAALRVPDALDMILHSALQASAGGFCELRVLIDVALLMDRVEDPAEMLDQAIRQNQGCTLWLLLVQVEQWTGISAPGDWLEKLQPGYFVRKALVKVSDQSILQVGKSKQRGHLANLLHLICTPGPILKLRELRRFLFRGEEGYLEIGFTKGAMPGFRQQTWLFGVRLRVLIGYLGAPFWREP